MATSEQDRRPTLEVGRRVHCILYGGKDGTIVAVHGTPAPKTVQRIHQVGVAGGRAAVDIVWDNGTQSQRVPESLVAGSVQWRLYDQTVGAAAVMEARRLAADTEARLKAEKEAADREFAAECQRLREAHPELEPNSPAKNIRTELKAAFPGTRFSVRQDGHNGINVRWTGGPEQAEVRALVGKYQHGHFDGMTDCYCYERSPWTEVFGGREYVFADRARAQ